RMVHVEDLIEPGPQQVRLAAVSPFLRPHRLLPLSGRNAIESRNADANILPEIAGQHHNFRQNKTRNQGKILN
ncbi:hypothetical protein, partial [Mesorhizobium sp. M1E.F.Ca.ET.041.01.1.1]|uniref:hypothetical protein n=1 Tax=Mesorhizobium sp. M1E.F.Ca.ET.041.01.1.1 TaxID=2496759 RepID=UPI001AEC9D9A